ncbi:hypothetical protein HMPREF3291_05185 [Bacillus sp. HMSC76G11]|nr:hypothetical protein HMPREF3291_05185 [Bacillus sp. HMSC76G11]
MTVRELYLEAIKEKHYGLKIVIEYLVNERKVLKMTDQQEQLTYFLQDKFASKMNDYLSEFEGGKSNVS